MKDMLVPVLESILQQKVTRLILQQLKSGANVLLFVL